jgi:drug/metabolite transporter (DMT)-like permease
VHIRTRTALCTLAAVVAFAGNSVLCRLALGGGAIDATSFTWLRLAAGAAALALIRVLSGRRMPLRALPWTPAVILIVYAIPFSFAYVTLTAGTGALILFGTVQVTMMTTAIVMGDRPHALQWIGLSGAIVGLVYLVMPGLAAPPLAGAALMAVAGVAWAFYTLAGRRPGDPVDATAAAFLRSLPAAALLCLAGASRARITPLGVALAAVSGAVTSGGGYVIWYVALRGLTAVRAAAVQLTVPIVAAVGGVVLMDEPLTLRLALSAVLVLGGIGLTLAARERVSRS